jgi:MFS family permease
MFSVPFVLVGAVSGKVDQRIGLRQALAAGMLWLALAFALLALIEPASGPLLVLGGLLAAGVGQGLAYNLSTTAAMAPIPQDKAGVASGVLNTIRMVGLAVGVALTGVLVRGLEYDKLAELLSAMGASVGAAERAEIAALLSGSPEAVQALARMAPAAAAEAQEIARASYDHGFEAGMILCAGLALVGAAAAMVGSKLQPTPISDQPPSRRLIARAFSGRLAVFRPRGVRRLVLVEAGLGRGHGVGLAEPAPEIDVATARRAERPVGGHPRSAADRAARGLRAARSRAGVVAHCPGSSIRWPPGTRDRSTSSPTAPPWRSAKACQPPLPSPLR